MLRWEKQDGGLAWFAYSGEILIGMVVHNIHDQITYDAACAVHMKWIAKGRGDVASFASGKKAVERAWKLWLERTALAPRS